MMFQSCFLAVEMKERITAKSIAPCNDRKPPEIFDEASSCARRVRPDCWLGQPSGENGVVTTFEHSMSRGFKVMPRSRALFVM
jgi:hypothetical protein